MADDFDELLAAPTVTTAPPDAVLVPAAPGGEQAFGAFEAADRFDRSIASWTPTLQSADADIIPVKPIADARARDVGRNDAYIQGGAQLHKDNIVGSDFLLNSKPSSKVVQGKIDEAWETEFQEEVEELFDLAAQSTDNLFDASGQNSFTELVRLAVGVHVFGGEVLATAEWLKDGRPFKTAIQMVDLDRLETPPLKADLNTDIRAGIRRNANGRPLSYFIRRTHPADYSNRYVWRYGDDQHKEVPATKPWGRRQVIHIFEQQRPDQTRGIAEMVSALKEIYTTKKFRDVTLQNAVTQSLYAATITSDMPTEAIMQRLGGQTDADTFAKALREYTTGYMKVVDQFAGASRNLKADGVRIPHLLPGTKFDLTAPGKGGPLGMEFEQSLLRYIAAALNVSYEQLARDYTNTNYSSARAAMTETWKFMQSRKKAIADKFATMIFRLWLEEMISADRLASFPASRAHEMYTDGRLNMVFEALARCEWIGASRGQIDELKETQAAVLRINTGLSTREAEIARLGGDWRKVLRQQKREQQVIDELGLIIPGSKDMMNAASGTPTEEPAPRGNNLLDE